MAEPYLTELKEVFEHLLEPETAENITVKHFFSGAAAYLDGHIFMSLSPIGLALKLAENDCDILLEQGGRPLQYFPKAPIKKGYVVVPAQVVNEEDALRNWISRSIDLVSS